MRAPSMVRCQWAAIGNGSDGERPGVGERTSFDLATRSNNQRLLTVTGAGCTPSPAAVCERVVSLGSTLS